MRTYKQSNSTSSQIPNHIEETVAAVAERAAQYTEEVGHDFLSTEDNAHLLMNDDPAIWVENSGENALNINQAPSSPVSGFRLASATALAYLGLYSGEASMPFP